MMSDCPPPNTSFLLLVCGDIESNPGPEVPDFVKNLESKVDSQGARLEGKLNKLIDTMNMSQSHYNQLEERFSTMENELKQNNIEFQRQLSLLQNCSSRLGEHVETYKEQAQEAHEELQKVTSRLNQLEIIVEKQDRQSRRSNLVLYGMRDERKESAELCTSNVMGCLSRNFPRTNWGNVDIEGIHRLGSMPNSSYRPRPVLVKFNRWSDAMIIMKDRESRDAMHKREGLRVGADLTRIQRDTLMLLKEQGKYAYFLNGKLTVKEPRSSPPRFTKIPAQPLMGSLSRQNGSYAKAAAAPPQEEHPSEQLHRSVHQRGDPTRTDLMGAPWGDSQRNRVSPGQRGDPTRTDLMGAPGRDSHHDVGPGQQGGSVSQHDVGPDQRGGSVSQHDVGPGQRGGRDSQHDVGPGKRGDPMRSDQMEAPLGDSQHDVSPGQRGDPSLTDQMEAPGGDSHHDASPSQPLRAACTGVSAYTPGAHTTPHSRPTADVPEGAESCAPASSSAVFGGQLSSPRGFGRGSPRFGAQRQDAQPKGLGGVNTKGRGKGKGKVVSSQKSRQSVARTVNQMQPSPVLTRSHSTGHSTSKRTPLVPAQQAKIPSDWLGNNPKSDASSSTKNNK